MPIYDLEDLTFEYTDWRTWKDIQGDLKDLPEVNLVRLEQSFLEMKGFAPAMLGRIGDDLYLLDANQRKRLFTRRDAQFRRSDGTIGYEYPSMVIACESMEQMIKRLLALNSHYGILNRAGFERLTEGLDKKWMSDTLFFGNIDMDFRVDFKKEEVPEPEEDTFDPEPPPVAITQPGDVYDLGPHRLMCGDSTDPEMVTHLMRGEKAHLLFTDPPYNVNYAELNITMRTSGKDWSAVYCSGWKDKMSDEDYVEFLTRFLANAKANLTEYAHYYIWYATIYHTELCAALMANGITYDKVPIIWKKQAAPISWARYKRLYEPCIFGGKDAAVGSTDNARWFGPNNENNIWEIKRDHNHEYVHPTQKPLALPARAMTNSTRSEEIVLDLFGGSGSTLISADKMDRQARLMEFEPAFCDVIVRRWIKHVIQNGLDNIREPVRKNGEAVDVNQYMESLTIDTQDVTDASAS